MKYIEIQKYLQKLKVFGVEDLKILDDKYDKSKISKWKNLGYIKQIIRGFYIYSEVEVNTSLIYFISNKIYFPSYVSLESSFNYYGIIPEQTFVITSVSTKKTSNFDTDIGYFSYKKIKQDLFWGYNIVNIQNNKVLIAELEKAILDYLYLKPSVKSIEDFYGLRWNKEVLKEKLDFEKMKKYLKIFLHKNLEKRVQIFFNYLEDDRSTIY